MSAKWSSMLAQLRGRLLDLLDGQIEASEAGDFGDDVAGDAIGHDWRG